jgi:cytochrome d ubiquinol oxidase subunit II
LFIGGLVPALVFGVAFGNVLQGVPFRFGDMLRMAYAGTLWDLFNPFALLYAIRADRCGDDCHARGLPILRARPRARFATASCCSLWVAFGRRSSAVTLSGASPVRRRPRSTRQTGYTRGWRFDGTLRRRTLDRCGAAARHLGMIATSGFSLFTFMLLSSLDPNSGLTFRDASSSLTALIIMAIAPAVALPVVLAYTAWVYHVLNRSTR